MKVAIVHDALAEFGGAERVLQVLLEIYPKADVFTAYYSSEVLRKFFPRLRQTHFFSLLKETHFLSFHTSLFQAFSPFLWKKFSLDSYDLIISNSSYINANFVKVSYKKHLQLVQSPPKNIAGLEKKTPLQRIFPYHLYLWPFYKARLKASTHIITNSYHMKNLMSRVCEIHSTVIYPPVNIPAKVPSRSKHPEYFICVGRIDRSKSLELPILACTKLGVHLKIIGKTNEQKYEDYIRSIAGQTIEFLGPKTDKEISLLYKKAKALIFSSKSEDFGIVPIEAMAHGVPVIAYYNGGPKETILKKVTGDFYYTHNEHSLLKVLKKFDANNFSKTKCYHHAKMFSNQEFKTNLERYISNMLKDVC